MSLISHKSLAAFVTSWLSCLAIWASHGLQCHFIKAAVTVELWSSLPVCLTNNLRTAPLVHLELNNEHLVTGGSNMFILLWMSTWGQYPGLNPALFSMSLVDTQEVGMSMHDMKAFVQATFVQWIEAQRQTESASHASNMPDATAAQISYIKRWFLRLISWTFLYESCLLSNF